MAVVAEYLWLTDPAGAVRVQYGKTDLLVVESDWAQAGGVPPVSTETLADGFGTTSATVGVWTEAITAQPSRSEAYVSNNHSDPSALLLVNGGPNGPKPLWPDSPAFFTSDWKGSIQVMSPTHASVRYSVGGC